MDTLNENNKKIAKTYQANKKIDHKLSVFGIFANRNQLEHAIEQLRVAGFRDSDMSVLAPDARGSQDLGHEKASKAPEGAVTGAAAGGVVGGTLGMLAGVGLLAIPGLGPLIAAGPIMATLAGVGVGGTVGTLTGALVGMGIPEYEAKRYESEVAKGSFLLSVHADDRAWADRAKLVLSGQGARDIGDASEVPSSSS